MLNFSRERALRFGFWAVAPQIIVRHKTRPRYERPGIPYESETEIPLLVNRRHIQSLDAPVFDGDVNYHTFFKSELMTPLEILLLKEEHESEEWQARQRRIAEFQRWQEKRRILRHLIPERVLRGP